MAIKYSSFRVVIDRTFSYYLSKQGCGISLDGNRERLYSCIVGSSQHGCRSKSNPTLISFWQVAQPVRWSCRRLWIGLFEAKRKHKVNFFYSLWRVHQQIAIQPYKNTLVNMAKMQEANVLTLENSVFRQCTFCLSCTKA